MLCAPSSGHLSFKAGTISRYFLSLMPEVAKSKIADPRQLALSPDRRPL
jgi:hypothetical protein